MRVPVRVGGCRAGLCGPLPRVYELAPLRVGVALLRALLRVGVKEGCGPRTIVAGADDDRCVCDVNDWCLDGRPE